MVGHTLRVPYDDVTCEELDSPYGTYDKEMVACAPIVKNLQDIYDINADDDNKEMLIKLKR